DLLTMHLFENYRKTPAYKSCGKISILFAFIIAIFGYFAQKNSFDNSSLLKMFTNVIFLLSASTFTIVFLILSSTTIFQSKQSKNLLQKINPIIDIGYVTGVILVYYSVFTLLSAYQYEPTGAKLIIIGTIFISTFIILYITGITFYMENTIKKIHYKLEIFRTTTAYLTYGELVFLCASVIIVPVAISFLVAPTLLMGFGAIFVIFCKSGSNNCFSAFSSETLIFVIIFILSSVIAMYQSKNSKKIKHMKNFSADIGYILGIVLSIYFCTEFTPFWLETIKKFLLFNS
ncbi:MAG: hypothetical protein II085_05660, partial [Alphaproteobacteria bacterium]|nr:hypothetical protein [Alphaproteobacteria bacterium]